MTTQAHPNVSLISRLDPSDLGAAADLFAEDVVWRFFNPKLPNIQGDYVGLEGIKTFFEKLAVVTKGSFRVNPVSITPVGDELVVMQTRNTLTLNGASIETDVVVVWRIVDGRIAEVWDIPSVYAADAPA